MRNFKDIISDVIHFITVDIWRIPLEELPKRKSFFYRQLRIILLAFRGFMEDKVQLRASALTYYSMLAIVPVLAMIFGIAKGFGIEHKVSEELIKNFHGQEAVLNWAINFANKMLEMTKGGFIAGAGFIILLWAVIKVLGNIENAFNNIWQISKSRSFFRKLSDYLSILLIAPILIFLSGSVTVLITSRVSDISEGNSVLGYIGPLILFLIKFSPYFLMWVLFMLIYLIMPNTKVKFGSALLAGIVAGTLFQLVQWGYVHFQVGVSRYNAIYGSFAALPLFIIWLQISWLIVLFGAELSFAYQNVKQYEFESDTENISLSIYKKMILLMSTVIIKRFEKGEKPMTSTEISNVLKLPIRLVRRGLNELSEAGILVETVTDNPKEQGYFPAIDIHKVTVNFVLNRWEERGSHHIRISETKQYRKIEDTLKSYEFAAKKSDANKLLVDM